ESARPRRRRLQSFAESLVNAPIVGRRRRRRGSCRQATQQGWTLLAHGAAVALTLSELAKRIGAELVGNPEVEVSSLQTLEDAGPGQVSFLSNPKYQKLVETTRASAVILSPGVEVSQPSAALLKAKDPYFAFREAVVALHGYRKHPHEGVHPKAHVDPSASVGQGTVIYPGVYVGPRAKIGSDCILYPNAVVYDDCVLGDRVILHAGAVVGQDGFGYA